MCLAIPGKIVEIENDRQHALVDYGDGTKRRANISLVEVSIGEYVLVHAGFAIQKLNEDEANKRLELFKEMSELADDAL